KRGVSTKSGPNSQTEDVFVEFLGPDLRGLAEHLAHVGKRRVSGATGGDVVVVIAETFLNDVQTGIQFGEGVGPIGELAPIQGLVQAGVRAAQGLKLLPDFGVTLVAIVGRDTGGVLEPVDVRAEASQRAALSVWRGA